MASIRNNTFANN